MACEGGEALGWTYSGARASHGSSKFFCPGAPENGLRHLRHMSRSPCPQVAWIRWLAVLRSEGSFPTA